MRIQDTPKTAREWLYYGLKPNAVPPQNREQLLLELERLNVYFEKNNIKSVEDAYFSEQNFWESKPKKKVSDLLLYLFLGWLVICISNLFDSIIGYALGIGIFYYGFYIFKDSRKAISDIGKDDREKYRKIYTSAENNFIQPNELKKLGDVIDGVRNYGCSTYEEALQFVSEKLRKEAIESLDKWIELNNNNDMHDYIQMQCGRCGKVFRGYVGCNCPRCGEQMNVSHTVHRFIGKLCPICKTLSVDPFGLCHNCWKKF